MGGRGRWRDMDGRGGTWRDMKGDRAGSGGTWGEIKMELEGEVETTCLEDGADPQNDWRANVAGSAVTPADVDRRYQGVVDQAKGGNYSTQGTILLSHQSSKYSKLHVSPVLPALYGQSPSLFHPQYHSS
jgi:hypothetical protein